MSPGRKHFQSLLSCVLSQYGGRHAKSAGRRYGGDRSSGRNLARARSCASLGLGLPALRLRLLSTVRLCLPPLHLRLCLPAVLLLLLLPTVLLLRLLSTVLLLLRLLPA